MKRRTFLAGTAAASTALPRINVSQASSVRVLRYVPQADLTVIDPVMTTAYITRFHATMVWDQLYGIDSQACSPNRRWSRATRLEDDGRLWTFTLRDGLRFHDGEPVRGRDCVASIKRWAARDPMGQALLSACGGNVSSRRSPIYHPPEPSIQSGAELSGENWPASAGHHAGTSRHDRSVPVH